MRRLRFLMLAPAVLALQGCWFVFIPGSVVSSVSDSITGAEGENCVPSTAKVGDRIRLPDLTMGSIESLSGTSIRCSDPNLPIRAKIARVRY